MRRALLLALLAAATAQAQWTLQDSHTTASLRGIHSIGNGIAWASGTSGTVLRTLDGGKNWHTCTVPPSAEKLDFRGIQAFDAKTAIVMSSGKGDQSRLYKTTDACTTWKVLFTNPDPEGFWDSLQFETVRDGYLLGDPASNAFYVAVTHDGGKTWTRQRNSGLAGDAKTQGAFAASNTSLSAKNGHLYFGTGGTAGAYIFEQTEVSICVDDCSKQEQNFDGNADKWKSVKVALGNGKEGSGVFSVGEGAFVAVGGDYTDPGNTSHTAVFRNGSAWVPATTPPHGYRSAVAYFPATKTWITVGPNGTDISTDDGRNWHPLTPSPTDPPDADKNWNALSLPFVVGPKGRIGILKAKTLNSH